MKITILTLFPEMFKGFLETSIIKRAIIKGIVEVECVQIRNYTKDKYGRTDTPPIGGGAGLIQKVQPIADALKAVSFASSYKVLFSPRGRTYSQSVALEYSKHEHLVLIAGHYEGVDERVNDYVDELLSLGDFILTGGEIPAMAVADSVIRLLEGAITSSSLEDESFNKPLLEYPQYTEPYEFEGKKVPKILYSGNHEAIARWRHKKALALTKELRPDLFNKNILTKEEKKILEELNNPSKTPKWEEEAIKKGERFLKDKK